MSLPLIAKPGFKPMQAAHKRQSIFISEHLFFAKLNLFSISSDTRSNRSQRFATYREKKLMNLILMEEFCLADGSQRFQF